MAQPRLGKTCRIPDLAPAEAADYFQYPDRENVVQSFSPPTDLAPAEAADYFQYPCEAKCSPELRLADGTRAG